MTFYSNKHLQIKRNNSVGNFMDAWAWDFYMEEKLDIKGEG